MSYTLGFKPTSSEEFYFISYNREDAKKISEALEGLPKQDLWYDAGIEYGTSWETTIGKRIKKCIAMILFVTKGIFAKGLDSYVVKEWKTAHRHKKNIVVIIMDDIDTNAIPDGLDMWWTDIQATKYINAVELENDALTKEIMMALKWNYNQPSEFEIIEFGSYPQKAGGTVKPIEWQVLQTFDKRTLLISRYLLDYKKYNEQKISEKSLDPVTWEICTLRKWLNTDFFKNAFTEDEAARILDNDAITNENPYFYKNSGDTIKNRIFLLNSACAKEFLPSPENRKCTPTEYALSRASMESSGKSVNNTPENWWWLRSPGESSNHFAMFIDNEGRIRDAGDFVTESRWIRPSLFIEGDVSNLPTCNA